MNTICWWIIHPTVGATFAVNKMYTLLSYSKNKYSIKNMHLNLIPLKCTIISLERLTNNFEKLIRYKRYQNIGKSIYGYLKTDDKDKTNATEFSESKMQSKYKIIIIINWILHNILKFPIKDLFRHTNLCFP